MAGPCWAGLPLARCAVAARRGGLEDCPALAWSVGRSARRGTARACRRDEGPPLVAPRPARAARDRIVQRTNYCTDIEFECPSRQPSRRSRQVPHVGARARAQQGDPAPVVHSEHAARACGERGGARRVREVVPPDARGRAAQVPQRQPPASDRGERVPAAARAHRRVRGAGQVGSGSEVGHRGETSGGGRGGARAGRGGGGGGGGRWARERQTAARSGSARTSCLAGTRAP